MTGSAGSSRLVDSGKAPSRRSLHGRVPYSDSEDSDDDGEEEIENLDLKEQMYLDKLRDFKNQLSELKEGSHPEFRKKLKKIDSAHKDRLQINDIWRNLEVEKAEKEFILEKRLALQELEEKKAALKENLLLDIEEKKKIIEQERYSLDINGDCMEFKAISTRKLRRRGAEPAPTVEKRRKPPTTALLNVQLDERDIEDDLAAIASAKSTHVVNKHSVCSAPLTVLPHNNEPRIENGKLYFDKKWFHKGQAVMVECKDGSKFNGTLVCAESAMIQVRKITDNSRLKITLAQLAHGKYLVRRRNVVVSSLQHH